MPELFLLLLFLFLLFFLSNCQHGLLYHRCFESGPLESRTFFKGSLSLTRTRSNLFQPFNTSPSYARIDISKRRKRNTMRDGKGKVIFAHPMHRLHPPPPCPPSPPPPAISQLLRYAQFFVCCTTGARTAQFIWKTGGSDNFSRLEEYKFTCPQYQSSSHYHALKNKLITQTLP